MCHCGYAASLDPIEVVPRMTSRASEGQWEKAREGPQKMSMKALLVADPRHQQKFMTTIGRCPRLKNI
jgi:hypothetical protein